MPRWFTRSQTVTHPRTNPAVNGRKSNSQPVDHKSDALPVDQQATLRRLSLPPVRGFSPEVVVRNKMNKTLHF